MVPPVFLAISSAFSLFLVLHASLTDMLHLRLSSCNIFPTRYSPFFLIIRQVCFRMSSFTLFLFLSSFRLFWRQFILVLLVFLLYQYSHSRSALSTILSIIFDLLSPRRFFLFGRKKRHPRVTQGLLVQVVYFTALFFPALIRI